MNAQQNRPCLVTILLALFLFLQILPATVTTVWTEDFENTDAGWTTVDLTGDSSHWQKITSHPMDSASSYSGDTSWWCGVDTFYQDNMNDVLVMNTSFDLSGKTNPRLKFWYFLDKDGNDKAYVDISTDGGTTWDEAVGDYSSAATWTESDLGLSAYIDSTITIRFRFSSNAFSSNYYGWFLDDIRLVNIPVGDTLYSFDFESQDVDSFISYSVIGGNTWDTTNTKYNSATHSYVASENLFVSTWCALQGPKMNLSTAVNPQLCFEHWYQFALGSSEGSWNNGAIVEITTDTSVTHKEWVKLYPVGGYPGYDKLGYGNPLGDTSLTGDGDDQGFYGYQTTWTQSVFDLSSYAGSDSIWIRFSVGNDANGWFSGQHWFIDDVMVKDPSQEDTIYFDDLEASPDSLYTMEEVPAGNWWIKADSSWLSDAVNHQWDAVLPYNSQDTSMYCGNQQSQNNDGTYDFADNNNMLLDNGLVSPFISLADVSGSDNLYLQFNERRKASSENAAFTVELQTQNGGVWQEVSSVSASSYLNEVEGNWVTRKINVTSFNDQDSVRLRFRAATDPGFSHLYWYVDDVNIQKSDTALIDYFTAIAAVGAPVGVKEKSDTFSVLSLRMYDSDDMDLETLWVTVENVSGIDSSDFEPIRDDITSGISVFDSSGSRLSLDESVSGWSGLTARLVFTAGGDIPLAYTDSYPFTVKMRTSATATNNLLFKATLAAGAVGYAGNGDLLQLGSAVKTNTITISNTIPDAPDGLEAHMSADSVDVELLWNAGQESDLWYYRVYRSGDSGFTADGNTLIDTTTDTVYIDQGPRDGIPLYYKVAAVDNGGDVGSASTQADTILPVFAPDPPLGPSASLGSDSVSVDVSWSAAPEADLAYYNLYRDTVNFFVPDSTNLFTAVSKDTNGYHDSAVRDSITYYYRVSAVDSNDAESGFNDIASTFIPVRPPAAPAIISAVPNGDKSVVTVTWTANTEDDLAGYNLYRDTLFDFSPGAGNLISAVGLVTTVDDSTVTSGYMYYYKLTAEDSAGFEGEYDSVTVDIEPPAAPTGLAAVKNGDSTAIIVTWDSNDEADLASYKLYRDTVNSFAPGAGNLLTTISEPDTQYTDAAVVRGLYYYYKLSAVDDEGNEGDYSGQAESPVPVELASFTAARVENGVILTWATVSEQDNLGWNIYRSVDGSDPVKVNSHLIPGAGDSQELMEYSWSDIDAALISGEIEYQLEQIDLSGTGYIAGRIYLQTNGISGELSLVNYIRMSPNPMQKFFRIGVFHSSVRQITAVSIYTVAGREVFDASISGNGYINWDGIDKNGHDAEQGIYYAKIISDGKSQLIRILKK